MPWGAGEGFNAGWQWRISASNGRFADVPLGLFVECARVLLLFTLFHYCSGNFLLVCFLPWMCKINNLCDYPRGAWNSQRTFFCVTQIPDLQGLQPGVARCHKNEQDKISKVVKSLLNSWDLKGLQEAAVWRPGFGFFYLCLWLFLPTSLSADLIPYVWAPEFNAFHNSFLRCSGQKRSFWLTALTSWVTNAAHCGS